jgi:hypothetical protein
MAFNVFQIQKIKEVEVDTAIKSDSANGLVKTRIPYTKIRKEFTVTPNTVIIQAEMDELLELWEAVRTVTPFVWFHPTKKDQYNNPVHYNVRFKEPIQYEQDASLNNYYTVDTFTLTEV